VNGAYVTTGTILKLHSSLERLGKREIHYDKDSVFYIKKTTNLPWLM
jgi:hypothetical protein